MPVWQVSYALNAAKAVLPFQAQLHALKRRIKPARTNIVQDWALSGALEQIAAINKAGRPVKDAVVLEIGSGWFPVSPLAFRAAGAKRVVLTDMHRLLHPTTLRAAIAHVAGSAEKVAQALGTTPDAVRERIVPPEGLSDEETMEWLGFDYLAPYDITKAPMIDIVTSHTVLEHIRPDRLEQLLIAYKAKLNPGGLMSHGVDHADHRYHNDRRLTAVDFLRYSDRAWDLLHINPQDYTNRMRHPDYLVLFEEAGFDVEVVITYLGDGLMDRYDSLKLWGRFKTMKPEDAVTTWSHYLLFPRISPP